ncbi:MAG: nicotinate phosphoribosyltransferase [Acidimicrobiia bacterium]
MSNLANSGLFTDLYELTMAAGFIREGLAEEEATFDLFVRRLPDPRQFLVSAGQSEAFEYLAGLSFNQAELDFLASTELFHDDALNRFANLRFSGEVWAVDEGEIVFANEPILRVTAPLIEAQIVETRLLNLIGSQTMVASKAARVAIACQGRPFVDFSARRDHGGDAAMQAARASWIGGGKGTSLVAAGYKYGLPLSGTMAHSYVMSFDDEREAFRTFARTFPDGAVLLIDTYDTEEGARRVVEVAAELASEGVKISGVRLDSGDLVRLSCSVRDILDEGGLNHTQIFASGDLDEYRITELLAAGAPIDAFGVGTQLGTSADAPSLGAVYKLVADSRGPKIKLAEDKVTLPGRKQVWRVETQGQALYDVVALDDEGMPIEANQHANLTARPLLKERMSAGKMTSQLPTLSEAQRNCSKAISKLPSRLASLQQRERSYEVRVSAELRSLGMSLSGNH